MGQIGIAVRDINRAGAVCKKYGMGPMRSFISTEKSVQNGELYGKKVDSIRFGTLMYEIDGVTFELLQPLENTVWSEFIENQGEGVCDIMFTPTKRYYEVLKERGIEEIMKFSLYNHKFSEDDIFYTGDEDARYQKKIWASTFSPGIRRKRRRRESIREITWQQALTCNWRTGAEPHLQKPMYLRMEKNSRRSGESDRNDGGLRGLWLRPVYRNRREGRALSKSLLYPEHRRQ